MNNQAVCALFSLRVWSDPPETFRTPAACYMIASYCHLRENKATSQNYLLTLHNGSCKYRNNHRHIGFIHFY